MSSKLPENLSEFHNLIERVGKFNTNVVRIGARDRGQTLSPSEARWLSGALKEEAEELVQAPSVIDQIDACGDAVIFALGGMFRMGLNTREIALVLHVIMDANFSKRAGVKAGREGAPDAVKPKGWVGPEERIRRILGE